MSACPLFDRVAVISDLHLPPSARHGNLSAETGRRLVEWTRDQSSLGAAGAALVLNGDIVDFLLVESRPAVLPLADARNFTNDVLERLSRAWPWIDEWLHELRRWLGAGGKLIVLTGNHDSELLHPDAAAAFTQWLAGDLAPADVERIELWRSGRPWLAKVGRWDVVVGHGHRGDPDNDVDPEPVFEALRRGDATFLLPPGSQVVLGPLARFKRAMTPDGRRRFPFLDALKPELPSVLLLLLYLDAPLVVSSLPASFGTLARLFTRRVGRRLSTGPALGSRMRGDSASRPASERASDFAREWPSDGASVPTPDAALAGLRADGLAGTPVERLADRLASDLCDVLSDDERAAPELLLTRLDDWLAPGREPFDSNEPSLRSVNRSAQRSSEQTLADHDGLSAKFLRAWLRSEARRSPAFFDTSARGALDDRIIAEQLPPNCGPRVVIAGHTHAARDIRLDAERVYLNTGTWTELLDLADFADTDAGLKRLIDRLEAGELPARRRLHWAEVTKTGPRLHEFQ